MVAPARHVQHRARRGVAERRQGGLVEAPGAQRAAEHQQALHVLAHAEPRARGGAVGAAGARPGPACPTTSNFGPSRPSIGNARKTRRANGASSRLVTPRWLSASVSTSGSAQRPRRQAHRARPRSRRRRARRRRRWRAASAAPGRWPAAPAATARAARSGLRRSMPSTSSRWKREARGRHELGLRPVAAGELDLGAASSQRFRDGQGRHDVSRRAAGRDHDLGHRGLR